MCFLKRLLTWNNFSRQQLDLISKTCIRLCSADFKNMLNTEKQAAESQDDSNMLLKQMADRLTEKKTFSFCAFPHWQNQKHLWAIIIDLATNKGFIFALKGLISEPNLS